MSPTRFARAALAAFLVAAVVAVLVLRPESAVAGPAPSCSLESGPVSTISYVWEAPDAWELVAWHIPAHSCAGCTEDDPVAIDSVSFVMRWIDPCSAQAEVSIVAASGDPGCRTPDFTKVLCGPASYAISGAAQATPYSLALPSGCCIDTDAFVVVRFSGLGQCGLSPTAGLRASTAPSVACSQYFRAPSPFPSLTDWSTVKPVALWMAVDAHCCEPVPAEAGSWGRVKSRYR